MTIYLVYSRIFAEERYQKIRKLRNIQGQNGYIMANCNQFILLDKSSIFLLLFMLNPELSGV